MYTVGEALLLLKDDDRLKLELVEDFLAVEDPYGLVEVETSDVLLAATLLEGVDVEVELVL